MHIENESKKSYMQNTTITVIDKSLPAGVKVKIFDKYGF